VQEAQEARYDSVCTTSAPGELEAGGGEGRERRVVGGGEEREAAVWRSSSEGMSSRQ
jgi:hypothetical protein